MQKRLQRARQATLLRRRRQGFRGLAGIPGVPGAPGRGGEPPKSVKKKVSLVHIVPSYGDLSRVKKAPRWHHLVERVLRYRIPRGGSLGGEGEEEPI